MLNISPAHHDLTAERDMFDRSQNAPPDMKDAPEGATPAGSERREVRDRRSNGRRLDERRKAGIGEIIPERRQGPRRDTERRTPGERRERRGP